MKQKVRVGLAGIRFTPSFWGYKDSQYQARAAELRQACSAFGAALSPVTRSFGDAEGGQAAARELNAKADLVVLDVATFPEGKAAAAFLDSLVPPLILWSRPETEFNTHIGHNSFCGANFLAGNLALKNRRFRHMFGDAASGDCAARLRTAIELVGAAKRASGSVIGLFGEGIVPKFFDLEVQPADAARLEQRWKIRFASVPITALVERAKSYPKAMLDKESKLFAARFRKVEVPGDALQKQVGVYKAMADIAGEEGFASTAVRCWPELQTLYGMWPCPGVSMLNDMKIPCACEGDPGGALDMLLSAQMSGEPTTVVDIVDWDQTQNRFTVWHCGPTACSWADRDGAKLIPHNVDGKTAKGGPAAGYPAVVDLAFAPGPVTVFRTLGAVDDEFAVQGRLVRAPQRRISGSCGSVGGATVYGSRRPVDAIRDEIMNRTLPHHFVAAHGHLFSGKASR